MALIERQDVELRIAAQTSGSNDVGMLADQIEALARQGGEAAPQFAALAEELRGIEQQQGLIDTFTKLKTETGEAEQALAQAQQRAQALGREFAATENPSRKLTNEFNRARREVTQAREALQGNQLALQGVRGEMQQAGIGTRNLAQTQIQLRQAASDNAEEFLRVQQSVAGTGEGVTEYGRAAQEAGGEIGGLSQETSTLGERLNSVKGELLAAGAAITAVNVVLGNAASRSAEFGQSMAEVSTLLDDTSGLAELSDQVRALSREFGGDVNANAKALYDIISAGAADAAEATEILTAANKLAVGGVTDVKVAADGLTSILNAYGTQAGTASEVSDALFTAMRAGKTTIDQLSGSLGQVAPLAATAGVSLEELLAATSAITLGGVQTSTAVTQLRGAISNIIKPTADAQKLARELGLEFNVAALRSRGLAGFLQEVADKTGGSTDKMARLFGSVEALNAVLTLTGTQAEAFGDILENMGEKAGATEDAVGKMMDTPAARARRFEAAMNDVRLSLGDAVTAFSPLLEALTSTLNLFNNAPGPIKATVAGLGALAVAAPAVNLAVRNLSSAWGTLTASAVASAPATAAAGRAAAASGVAAASAVPGVNALAAAKSRLAVASRAVLAATGPVGLGLAALSGGAVYLASKFNDARVAALDAELAVEAAFEQPRDEVSPALEKVADTADRARFQLDSVQKQFVELSREGAGVAEVLAKIAAQADFSTVDGVAQLVSDMDLLRQSAYAAGEEVQTAIVDRLAKLSAQDLRDFGIQAEMAFGRAEISAEQLAGLLDARVVAAARQLGVEVNLAADGMSARFRDAAASLDTVVQSFNLLEAAGVDAGATLEQAVMGALKAAESPEELEHLAEVVRQLGENGQASELQVTRMLEVIGKKADEVTPGINSLSESLKVLGITSDAALRETAAKFEEAYQAVVRMGGSVREQQEAFRRYATAAVAANNGVVDSVLQAQAAQHGLRVEVDQSGRTIVSAMNAGRDAIDNTTRSVERLRQEVAATGSEIESTAERFQRWNEELDRSRGGGGGEGPASFSSPFQALYARAEQVGGLALRKEMEEMYQGMARGRLSSVGGVQSGARAVYQILGAMQQAVDEAQLAKEAEGSQFGSGPGRPSATPAAGGTYSVSIDLGGSRRTVNTASDADARQLIDMLQELERRAA